MTNPGDELHEIWDVSGTEVTVGGDAAIIKDWLDTKLDKIKVDWSGWLTLSRHRDSGQFWELTYPMSEMHGGGPKLLRCLGISDSNEWETPAKPEKWGKVR